MVVAAAGLDQAELVGEPADRVDVLSVERAVVDLEAAQADRLQVAQEPGVVGGLAEVGQDRQAAGRPNRLDRRAGPIPWRGT